MTFLLAGCSSSSSDPENADPGSEDGLAFPGETWETVDPAEVGLDVGKLAEARAYAFAPGRNTQGVVIVRGGKIAAEWYADDADQDTPATSWSMSKSYASTLIGIAIDQGKLSGVDMPMTEFIPEWKGTAKEDITLEHVLRMQTGIPWDEAVGSFELHLSPLQLDFSINREGADGPGQGFNYSSADTILLSWAIETLGEGNAGAFAQQQLFGPIGMKADWWDDADGHTTGYCCLDSTSREYARFGLLMARRGKWEGEQVVSEQWIDQATAPADNAEQYGFQWWLNTDGSISEDAPRELYGAFGLHSQRTYVFEELDLVVVRNGTYNVKENRSFVIRSTMDALATEPPDEWDNAEFLRPILEAVMDEPS